MYNPSTCTVQGHPAEKIAPMNRQKVADRPVMPVMALSIDFNWLPSVQQNTVSEVECDYRWYHGANNNDEGLPSDVWPDVVDDPDDIFVHKSIQKEDGGFSFTGDDHQVIATALACLSKILLTSSSELGNLVEGWIDEVEAFLAPTAKAVREVQRQKGFASKDEKSANIALNDVSSPLGWAVAARTREVE